MLAPETRLYVYEVEGDARNCLDALTSFVGLWNEEKFSYLFFTEPQDKYVTDCLSGSGCVLKRRHDTVYSEWHDGLPAAGLAIGDLLFVPDDHPSPPSGALRLDPSVVFGDGTHPTTLACLEFVRAHIAEGAVKSLLDLGTGTGILSIAAAALGVPRITAVDLNILAVQTAARNVNLNGFDSIITVEEGDAVLFVNNSYDLAVANLPFEVLKKIAELQSTTLIPNWVISGISETQGKTIEGIFFEKGFGRNGFKSIHPWVTFVMTRNP